eukprot:5476153-Ditylum_brightwellii.AAC.1
MMRQRSFFANAWREERMHLEKLIPPDCKPCTNWPCLLEKRAEMKKERSFGVNTGRQGRIIEAGSMIRADALPILLLHFGHELLLWNLALFH